MLASTAKLRPRYFLIVLALAGDSTITRLVVPLATGVSRLDADERVEVDLDVVARLPLLEAVLLEVVFPPVVFFVVAIYSFVFPVAGCPLSVTEEPVRQLIIHNSKLITPIRGAGTRNLTSIVTYVSSVAGRQK